MQAVAPALLPHDVPAVLAPGSLAQPPAKTCLRALLLAGHVHAAADLVCRLLADASLHAAQPAAPVNAVPWAEVSSTLRALEAGTPGPGQHQRARLMSCLAGIGGAAVAQVRG